MWCIAILGLLTIVYGIVNIRDARSGGPVEIGSYKGTRLVSPQRAVLIGAGTIALGVIELFVAFLWR
jgi:hypothetical protein